MQLIEKVRVPSLGKENESPTVGFTSGVVFSTLLCSYSGDMGRGGQVRSYTRQSVVQGRKGKAGTKIGGAGEAKLSRKELEGLPELLEVQIGKRDVVTGAEEAELVLKQLYFGCFADLYWFFCCFVGHMYRTVVFVDFSCVMCVLRLVLFTYICGM